MNIVWKLLRNHISIAQFCGFFIANLCGMFIVLLGIQFYKDVSPVFSNRDNFLKKGYVVISKPVSTINSVFGNKSGFSENEIAELTTQPFTQEVGEFISSQFQVVAGIGADQLGMQMSTEMFFESVPDDFIDINLNNWNFKEDDSAIPIILPKNYLNLYNFGFAKSKNLPQLTENLIKVLNLDIRIRGNGRMDVYKGRISGFSNRLNTILVPEQFMKWANSYYAPDKNTNPSRLILELKNPNDERVVQYLQEKGYETENDGLDSGKASWFLRIVVGIVLVIGIIICVLSFFILMLSIYLLLQKNTSKLENLMLIGYSPSDVASPYQRLTLAMNLAILVLAVIFVATTRHAYMSVLDGLLPPFERSGISFMCMVGLLITIFVSFVNNMIIKRKVYDIWLKRT